MKRIEKGSKSHGEQDRNGSGTLKVVESEEEWSSFPSIKNIPEPVLLHILSYCSIRDLASLSSVSKLFKRYVYDMDFYWENRLSKTFEGVLDIPNDISNQFAEIKAIQSDESLKRWEKSGLWKKLYETLEMRRIKHAKYDFRIFQMLSLSIILLLVFISFLHYNLFMMGVIASKFEDSQSLFLEDFSRGYQTSRTDMPQWLISFDQQYEEVAISRKTLLLPWGVFLSIFVVWSIFEMKRGRFLRHAKLLSFDFAANVKAPSNGSSPSGITRRGNIPRPQTMRGLRELMDVNLFLAKLTLAVVLFLIDYMISEGNRWFMFVFSPNLLTLIMRTCLHSVIGELLSNLVVRFVSLCKSERTNKRGLQSIYSSFCVSTIINFLPSSDLLFFESRTIIILYLSLYFSIWIIFQNGHPFWMQIQYNGREIEYYTSDSPRISLLRWYFRGCLILSIVFVVGVFSNVLLAQYSIISMLKYYHFIIVPIWLWLGWSTVFLITYFCVLDWKLKFTSQLFPVNNRPKNFSFDFPWWMILW
eukprot:TRINITY_DN8317_c0_g1_i1.p1 TRINITY_DN8317_c0_g1~~TRINITY_DN8317_c0_g1_i1.p1  ORF type:complete len:529 (+),score=156.99 TRINITY_DN8317_c0_g1_i1:79-1665(+)